MKTLGDVELQSNTIRIQNQPPNNPPGKIKWGALIWHMIIVLLVLGYLAAFANYLRFKVQLYSRKHHELMNRPWLIILLFCEFVYFVSSIISAADLLLPPPLRVKPDPPELEEFPSVDILLPCCKEPTEVPIDSIQAALALDYPPDRLKVLVLDDGGDDDLKAYCEALHTERVQYLRRVKIEGVPHNFKCGNLNYGLENSVAEFVVMMDADMILHSSFLKVLLPHIVQDPQVAFGQIPQSFYNLPAGDPLNDACAFGYDRVMVHRNTFSAASCVGTGAIFRRKHIDEIGGFQPQSITEDTMTAFFLFNAGYKSVYLNRKLQAGLTPWTFEGYVKQRCRWTVGAIQQYSATWKTMLGPKSKLSLVQKACYFWHTGYYFLSIINIIMAILFLVALGLHLQLTVGDQNDNRQLIICLSVFLVLWRLMWISVWAGVPLSIQGRNRDESHFWWMTPFFFQTIMTSIFSYTSTFKFTPTSNIDRKVANNKARQSYIMKQLGKFKYVRVHIIFIVLALSLVSYRTYWIAKDGFNNCKHDFYVVAISFFLLSICAHMLIPVIYVLFPSNYKLAQRKSLLQYNNGVVQFSEGDFLPKWHWSVALYELMSYLVLFFWVGMLVIVSTKTDKGWCKDGYL